MAMKALRVFVAALLATAVVVVITRSLVPRMHCNVVKGEVNRDVRRFSRIGYEYDRVALARRNLAKLDPCIERFPEDYQLFILRGANLRVLGSPEEAVEAFQHALTLTERPEIYAQIGEIEVERGNIEAARLALTKAATFNVAFVETVDQPLRGEIYAAVLARHRRLREAKK
jgi:tetratricopeptide (TPR) repeat protein